MTQKNILSLFKYDITNFFRNEYFEVDVQDTPAMQVIDYEQKLPESEFNIFDTIRLRILFDKNKIEGKAHINVSYYAKKRRSQEEDVKIMVNKLFPYLQYDENMKGAWDDSVDSNDFNNHTFSRIWPVGTGHSFLSLLYKEVRGLELNFLFINNLLKYHDKELKFQ